MIKLHPDFVKQVKNFPVEEVSEVSFFTTFVDSIKRYSSAELIMNRELLKECYSILEKIYLVLKIAI